MVKGKVFIVVMREQVEASESTQSKERKVWQTEHSQQTGPGQG